MKQTMKMLLSLVLVAILMVSALAIPAFAAPDDGTEPTVPESEKFVMTKNLIVPENMDISHFNLKYMIGKTVQDNDGGTETLTAERVAEFENVLSSIFGFAYYITKPTYNGELLDGYTNGNYFIHAVQTFPYGEVLKTNNWIGTDKYYRTERSTVALDNGTKNEIVTIPDFFEKVSAFDKAGQYTFEVEEATPTSVNNYEPNNSEVLNVFKPFGIDISYSNAKYKVYVNVATALDSDGKVIYKPGTTIPAVYIDDIVIEVIIPDNDSQKAGDKVDHVSFTNSIVQKPVDIDPEDPEDQKKTLKLEKKVTGKYGDYSKEFTFDFKIDKPDVEAAEDTVAKAAKLDKDGKKIGEEQFTYGQNKEVNLKAGESLVFTDVYFDSTWSFTEQGVTNGKTADGYTVTQAIKSGGTDADPADGEYIVKVDGENSHVITNDKSEIETPTGVLIDNLPYIIIFAAAAGGIVLFLAMKRRRRRNEE